MKLLGCVLEISMFETQNDTSFHALVFHSFDFFLNFYAHLNLGQIYPRFDQDLNKFKT
jgi:hypothetical protein